MYRDETKNLRNMTSPKIVNCIQTPSQFAYSKNDLTSGGLREWYYEINLDSLLSSLNIGNDYFIINIPIFMDLPDYSINLDYMFINISIPADYNNRSIFVDISGYVSILDYASSGYVNPYRNLYSQPLIHRCSTELNTQYNSPSIWNDYMAIFYVENIRDSLDYVVGHIQMSYSV